MKVKIKINKNKYDEIYPIILVYRMKIWNRILLPTGSHSYRAVFSINFGCRKPCTMKLVKTGQN